MTQGRMPIRERENESRVVASRYLSGDILSRAGKWDSEFCRLERQVLRGRLKHL